MTRRLLSMVFAGAVSLGIAVLVPGYASACSCAVPASSSPRELAKESFFDAMFAGEVSELDEPRAVMGTTAIIAAAALGKLLSGGQYDR